MTLLHINRPAAKREQFSIFDLGFRPFFIGASLFAGSSIYVWMLVYAFHFQLALDSVSNSQWHSHEMIFGYSMAVIAGFLLTAVANWTGIKTIHGHNLRIVFSLWLLPRVLLIFGTRFLPFASAFDIMFMCLLFTAVASPIVKSRQWQQLSILLMLSILTIANICFYAGALGYFARGVSIGIYLGLYTIVILILSIGARVFPAFITNGVDCEVKVPRLVTLAIGNTVVFLIFVINQLYWNSQGLAILSAVILFAINALRLILWHTPGLWRKPLLWSLFLSFLSIDLGFLFFALKPFLGFSEILAVHLFGFGGIGLATMGMMTRVTLGHTGRSVKDPPKNIVYALRLLAIGVVSRIALPLFCPALYVSWILLSQTIWIIAFGLFFIFNVKFLSTPGLD